MEKCQMDNIQYAEELVREFLVFRGFTNTLQAFESELSTDIGKGFQVEKILDLIFSVYVRKFEAEKLVALIRFLRRCFTAPSDTTFLTTLAKLETSVLRFYIIQALQAGRKDKVVEFFEQHGNGLLQKADDWTLWFVLPYLKNASLDPQFRVYFSKEWSDALLLSFRNFLSEMLGGTRIPALLKLSTEKSNIKYLKKDIRQLNMQLTQLQALLETKEAQLSQLRSSPANVLQRNCTGQEPSSETSLDDSVDRRIVAFKDSQEVADTASTSHFGGTEDKLQHLDHPDYLNHSTKLPQPESDCSSSSSQHQVENVRAMGSSVLHYEGVDSEPDVQREEDFSEVKVKHQESFLGHTSPISRCRFSASGTNIASASSDGTVRIWTYDSSVSTSRNATIYCGAEIMSLEWECKSDRLLLIGTADGGIKAWNVDAKRVVCDFTTTAAFPSVLDMKCSPIDPVFVSAAASKGHGLNNVDKWGHASLTVWNLKTWKSMTVLPLGEDPPAITSVCFNHNGKILAASAVDGMIHMFDMSAGLQITGWPAHDSAVSSVQFGPDETSIFSLGCDGKIFEWSLHNQGRILWSRDYSRFCNCESTRIPRHEMALDSHGKRLLVTSSSTRSPIYHVQSNLGGLKTLPHSACITTVDWHPTLPIFLTGSADHSVRVTSIL
ncbi:uncharacterized protein LOC116266897 [Nymphaea colorata]|nr:uncharacterized protein LOC116266897 [Nymphaea colorata]